MESHAEFLRRVTLDDEMVEALLNDYENAPISDAERKMCDFAIRITNEPLAVKPSQHNDLRDAGFDDTAILQITLIASWFNYINRVADTLGIGRDEVT